MPTAFRYTLPTKSPPRATVVFDLDETLINAQHLPSPCPPLNAKHEWSKWRNDITALQRFPPHSQAFVVSYPPEGTYKTTETLIVHYRPDVIPLLRWCFAHCYVAFWSTGTERYVRDIVMRLLYDCGQQPKDVLFAWARTPADASVYAIDKIKFVDVFTNAPVRPPRHAMRHASSHKDIAYIFERFPQLSREHVVLVDNLPSHMVGNSPANVLWCPPFTYLNAHDTVLTKMLDALKAIAKTQQPRATPKPATRKAGRKVTANTTAPSKATGGRVVASVPDDDSSDLSEDNPTPTTSVCFSANDLRDVVSSWSPTNDNVQYVDGYVNHVNSKVYQIDSTQLKRHQRVVVPYRERYTCGTIVKTDHRRELVHVRIDAPKHTRQARATAKRSITKRANVDIAVPFALVVGVNNAHDGKLVARYVNNSTW